MNSVPISPSQSEISARRQHRGLGGALLALAVALLAAFAYRGAITDDFTGGDTVALIEQSRIESFDDVERILTQPMLPIITKFFRPTSNLSYSLDHALWGLEPRGYHRTDVAVHALVCALLVLFVRRWSGSLLAAAVAGFAFALHPILMEVVPTTTRRQDLLGGLFVLLALLCLPRIDREKQAPWRWIPALIAGGLALGAKESGVLLPALVFLWTLSFAPRAPGARPDWVRALRSAAPFAVLALAFLLWRGWVLGGAGGNAASWRWDSNSLRGLAENSANFLGDLCYPLRVVFHPFGTSTDRAVTLVMAVALVLLVPSIRRWWLGSRAGVQVQALPGRAALEVALVLLVLVLSFAVTAPLVRGAIEKAYADQGWPALARGLGMGRGRPVEVFLWRGFDFLRVGASFVLLLAALWLAWSTRRAWTIGSRLWVLPAAWLALHLALFLAVQRYHAWNATMPAIPFCCLLGLAFAHAWSHARPIALLLGAALVWMAAYSPLVRGVDAWSESGRFNSRLIAQLTRLAQEVPAGSALEFHDFPNRNLYWQDKGPQPSSAFTLNEASLKSWLRMSQPDKQLTAKVLSMETLPAFDAPFELQWTATDATKIDVRLR